MVSSASGGAGEVGGRPSAGKVTRLPLVDRSSSEADALTSVFRRLSAARSVDEVMAVTTQAARVLVNADGVTFVLRDGDLCYYADEDAVGPLWKGKRFPIDACISGWVMQHGEAVRIPATEDDDRIPQDAYRPTFVKSLAMVPIRKEDPIGAMGAYWASAHSASCEEIERLQTIADAAARDLVKLEEERQLLVQELNHRAKNLFAVVGAMVTITAGKSKTVQEMSEALTGRIEALASAHDLIRPAVYRPSGFDETDLKDLIEQLLAPHLNWGAHQCRVMGSKIAIGVIAATKLALVIHELATNAAKYGALSTPSGTLRVAWQEANESLVLNWEEASGPQQGKKPDQPGFGSKLIDVTVTRQLGGAITYDWGASGLQLRLSVPLKSLQD